MRRSFQTMIPRNDLAIPRETSALAPIRNPESLNRMYLGVAHQAKRVLAFGNKLSQLASQQEAGRQPGFSLPPTTPFYPFKIYQPTNLSDFVGQTVQTMIGAYATGAPLQTCKITDANTPTNLSASPPTISIADTWRFWAVRDGIVEVRQNYAQDEIQASVINNHAIPIIPIQTDGVSSGFISFDDDTTKTNNPPLVVGYNGKSSDSFAANIWLEVIQDTSGSTLPTVNVRGYFSTDQTGVFEVYNNGDLAVGVIAFNWGQTGIQAVNYTFDHWRNRYPCGNGNWPGSSGNGTVSNFRGQFVYFGGVDDNENIPNDLTNQLFYPGDLILGSDPDNAFDGSGFEHPWQAPYIFTGAIPAFFASDNFGPFTDSNWTQLEPTNIAT